MSKNERYTLEEMLECIKCLSELANELNFAHGTPRCLPPGYEDYFDEDFSYAGFDGTRRPDCACCGLLIKSSGGLSEPRLWLLLRLWQLLQCQMCSQSLQGLLLTHFDLYGRPLGS